MFPEKNKTFYAHVYKDEGQHLLSSRLQNLVFRFKQCLHLHHKKDLNLTRSKKKEEDEACSRLHTGLG
jgi:hypothetical protein